MIFHVPIDGKWGSFTDKRLEAIPVSAREKIKKRWELYENNRLSCFLPHGVPWHAEERKYADGKIVLPPSEYPARYKNDGVAFINDRKNDYVFLLASRKTGKTCHGAAKMAFAICECDPEWPCFTENGIEYHEWEGSTVVVVASFGQSNLKDVWSVYQEILPRYELGQYAPNWGKLPGEKGIPKEMNFGDGKPKDFTLERSRSKIIFLSYSQQQHIWESFKAQHLHADEQIKLALLRAWEDGSSTMGDFTQAIFTLSGFVLKERPEDTGAAGPLKPIWDGRAKKGRTVGRYNLDMETTPDVIVSQKKKKERYDRYVNPEIKRSDKDARRGLAVYYPGWEPGGGLLFGADVWDRQIHLIKPLWADDKVPKDWTKWRVIDYSDKKTTCCSWWAVGPKYIVLYRVLYESDLLVAQSARKIIEMSHNRQIPAGIEPDVDVGATYQRWEEDQCGEQFYTTLLDARAAKWRKDSRTVMELFQRHGIQSIMEASAEFDENQIPRLKDLLLIDRDVPHPFNKGPDGKPLMGASRVYFFDIPCIEPAVEEIEGMPEDPKAEGKKVMDHRYAHDFIDTAKYFASDDPRYYGAVGINEREERHEEGEATPYTGY